uniref:Uncharacterized protein n=1 Tax=Arundo donax TaxID=35708 RepID=A0A0A9ESF6_ARUDO
MSGSSAMDSAESSAFSTSSRIVVYRDLPGLSNPAMFLFSAKNSAGDFCLRRLLSLAVDDALKPAAVPFPAAFPLAAPAGGFFLVTVAASPPPQLAPSPAPSIPKWVVADPIGEGARVLGLGADFRY